MIRPLGIGFFILAVLGGTAAALLAQRSLAAVDFLDEKLKIPDSARFTEAEFTQSGVGLSFGVDKRLSYMIGRYDDAARRFEDSAARFPYKSEIWVFLARSYFHMKAPQKALAALDRAAAQMAGSGCPSMGAFAPEPARAYSPARGAFTDPG
jgi:tetratricopeptide (TPR) repeat protein